MTIDTQLIYADGYEILGIADDIDEAMQYIKDEAICTAENTHPLDLHHTFPIRFVLTDMLGDTLAEGTVDEEGVIIQEF